MALCIQCVIYQMDRRASELVAYCSGRGKRFRRAVSGLVGTAYVRGSILNLSDVRKHGLYEPTLDNLPKVKPRSILFVPVLSHLGVPIGLLQAVNRTSKTVQTLCPADSEHSGFTARDEQILESLANQVSTGGPLKHVTSTTGAECIEESIAVMHIDVGILGVKF